MKTFRFIVIGAMLVVGVFLLSDSADAAIFTHDENKGDYCLSPTFPNNQTAIDALSLIEYGKVSENLSSDERNNINTLLNATEARSPQGLVYCGRSCDDPTTEINEAMQCQLCNLIALPQSIINTLVFTWMPMILAILIVSAGVLLMLSSGNPDRRKKAIQMIKWAIIGYVIMLSAWVVVNGALSLLGANENFGDWWSGASNCGQ